MTHRHSYLIIVLISLCLSIFGSSQKILWKNYTSGKHLRAFAEYKNILWIGTHGGLVKYDRSTENTIFFNRANSDLPDNQINALAVDSAGILWIGAEVKGLISYDGTIWKVFDTNTTPLLYNTINHVAIDAKNRVWVGTGYNDFWGSHASLALYSGGTNWEIYSVSNSKLPSEYITALVASTSGDMWIGTVKGLVHADDTVWTPYTSTGSGIPSNYISALSIDKAGKLWVGLFRKGVACLSDTTWSYYNQANSSLPDDWVISLECDTAGSVWIGTERSGVAQVTGNKWTVYDSSNTILPHNYIPELLCDNSGLTWVGTKKGLFTYNGVDWNTLSTSNSGLPSNTVNAICFPNTKGYFSTLDGMAIRVGTSWTVIDSIHPALSLLSVGKFDVDGDHNIWASLSFQNSSITLGKFDGSTWTLFDSSNNNLPNRFITDIAIDKNGKKWFATLDSGLVSFDGTNWQRYTRENSDLASNHLQQLITDSSDALWCTYAFDLGITKFDGTNWTHFTSANSDLPENKIMDLAVDTTGAIWLATITRGFVRFDGVTWNVYNGANSGLPHPHINCLTCDKQGNVWLGMYRSCGLVKFDGTKCTSFSTENSGISTDCVMDIAVDHTTGNIWMANLDAGLSVYNEKGFTPIQKEPAFHTSHLSMRISQHHQSALVSFSLQSMGIARLAVYDVKGRKITTLIDELKNAGSHTVKLYTNTLSSGSYLLHLESPKQKISKRFVVVK